MDGTTATAGQAYTVGELARLAHVSVRTLHHYDAIGLLGPSDRTTAGYRLYRRADLERLRQILLFRELEFPLESIRRIMLDPAYDARAALVAQRERLAARAERMDAILAAIDSALVTLAKGIDMDDETMFEVFGEDAPVRYADEVRERWGATDAYAESTRRAARYDRTDWERIKQEGGAITMDLADALGAGEPIDGPVVQALVERHRLHIDRSFYPCSVEMHVGLGDMYVADPRFAATYDGVRPGLARFLRDAIRVGAGIRSAPDRRRRVSGSG